MPNILEQILSMGTPSGQPSSAQPYRASIAAQAEQDPQKQKLEMIANALTAFGGGMAQPGGGKASHWTTRLGGAFGQANQAMDRTEKQQQQQKLGALKGLYDFDKGTQQSKLDRLKAILSAQTAGSRDRRAGETAGLAQDRFGLSKEQFAHKQRMDEERLKRGIFGGTRKSPHPTQLALDIEKLVNRRFSKQPDPLVSSTEEIDKFQKDREKYRGQLEKKFGGQPRSAPAIKQPAMGDTGKYTNTNPAKPAKQAEWNALPSGSVYLNPRDGKLYTKK